MDSLTSDIEFGVQERKGLSQVVFGELVHMLLNCSGKVFMSRLLELESVVKSWSTTPNYVTTNANEDVELNETKPDPAPADHSEEQLVMESTDEPLASTNDEDEELVAAAAGVESTSSSAIINDKLIVVPGPISQRLLPQSVKIVLNALASRRRRRQKKKKKLLRCMVCDEDFLTRKSLRMHIAKNHLASNGRWRQGRDDDDDDLLKLSTAADPSVVGPCSPRRSARHPRRYSRRPTGSSCSSMATVTCLVCETCGKEVSTAGSLKRHMVEIHGEDRRQYTCEICGVSLTSKSSLNRHKLQLHMPTRKHACAECGREFALRQTLVQHINGVHLKYRPHLCPLCGDRFLKRDNLRNHTRLVHRDKFNQL